MLFESLLNSVDVFRRKQRQPAMVVFVNVSVIVVRTVV